MKLNSAAFVLLFLVARGVYADDAGLEKVIIGKVQEINSAAIAGDFGKVADLTYPKVVEAMGGRQKMVSTMEAAIKELKAQGYEFRSSKIEAPSAVVKSGSDLFVVVPFMMEIKVPGGKVHQRSFVIGISSDAGKSWLFVNGDLDIKLVKQFLPSLPDDLKLPEKQQAVIEKDK